MTIISQGMMTMKLFDVLSPKDKKKARKLVTDGLRLYRLLNGMEGLSDEQQQIIQRIERAVNNLPNQERELISVRYMQLDSDYITDYEVYNYLLETPISPVTYALIRDRAVMKLALSLNIEGGVEIVVKSSLPEGRTI